MFTFKSKSILLSYNLRMVLNIEKATGSDAVAATITENSKAPDRFNISTICSNC